MKNNILNPVSNVKIVEIDELRANDYNPNKVSRENLELLKQSILTNGWTLPIVVRPDYTIIDGFHRWTVAKEIRKELDGKVPIVIVDHKDHTKDIYGTITHNRARGTHLLDPMKNIIKELLDAGKTIKEISKQIGMKEEEIFRLSDLSRDKFLDLMIGGEDYSKARIVYKY